MSYYVVDLAERARRDRTGGSTSCSSGVYLGGWYSRRIRTHRANSPCPSGLGRHMSVPLPAHLFPTAVLQCVQVHTCPLFVETSFLPWVCVPCIFEAAVTGTEPGRAQTRQHRWRNWL